jgi:hypothetical protein
LVTERGAEQGGGVVDQRAGFVLVDVGQFIVPIPPRLAAVPAIGLLGFGVDAVDDELLAVA